MAKEKRNKLEGEKVKEGSGLSRMTELWQLPTLPSVSFDPRSFIDTLFLSKLLLTLLHYFIIFG